MSNRFKHKINFNLKMLTINLIIHNKIINLTIKINSKIFKILIIKIITIKVNIINKIYKNKILIETLYLNLQVYFILKEKI